MTSEVMRGERIQIYEKLLQVLLYSIQKEKASLKCEEIINKL